MIGPLVSVGDILLMNSLIESVRPYRHIVVPGFFFGFFAVAFTAIVLGSRWQARPAFLVSVFVLLLVFNFVLPMALSPFVAWSQFSNPTPETVQHDEIRIVDANGKELKMDNRATLTFDGISMAPLTSAMVEEYDEDRNEAVTRHLLNESEAYRHEVNSRSASRFFKFPHHGLTNTWTPEVLEEYDEFVGIRIYRMTFVTSADGTEIEHYEERVLLEIYPDGPAPPVQGTANGTPPDGINRTALNPSTSVVG